MEEQRKTKREGINFIFLYFSLEEKKGYLKHPQKDPLHGVEHYGDEQEEVGEVEHEGFHRPVHGAVLFHPPRIELWI